MAASQLSLIPHIATTDTRGACNKHVQNKFRNIFIRLNFRSVHVCKLSSLAQFPKVKLVIRNQGFTNIQSFAFSVFFIRRKKIYIFKYSTAA